jgi:prophage maintenance system killer protein
MGMVSYPTVEDVIESNKIALRVTLDRKPHKLLGRPEGIQAKIDGIRRLERKGITYQAACFMKEFAGYHVFSGANHRTAYLITMLFLTRNGQTLRNDNPPDVEAFMAEISQKQTETVQGWIEQNMIA